MSKVHYFQRYGSKENWVTNSTLLLLSRLYHYNRLKFENIINLILTESNLSLNIGVDFAQQEKGINSVVDGVISQDSFKVVIETKLYDNFTTDQLTRHLGALNGGYSQKVLLALSKNKVGDDIRSEIIKTLSRDDFKNIQFASTTYEDIYQTISSNLSEYDLEMREILDDYISLCQEQGLTNIQNRTMLAFTASSSLKENLKYNIYYDPAVRTHSSPFKYIGLYVNKAVVAIGKLEKIVHCNYENGNLVAQKPEDLSKLSEDEYNRIKGIIENTDYFDLKSGSKFFLVEKFYETNFIKTSFSSIRAKRYFRLDEIEGFKEEMTADQLAAFLDKKGFE